MIKLTQHVNIKLSHFALVVIRPSTHQDLSHSLVTCFKNGQK